MGFKLHNTGCIGQVIGLTTGKALCECSFFACNKEVGQLCHCHEMSLGENHRVYFELNELAVLQVFFNRL